MIWFQFLLGTLKTRRAEGDPKVANWVSIPFRYAENIFFTILFGVFHVVSIPFRYAENFFSGYRMPCSGGVSIPFRYAENQGQAVTVEGFYDEFQFLLGTLKTSFAASGSDVG